MLLLLPPSETKHDGGTGGAFDFSALRFGSLDAERRSAVAALLELARDPVALARVLKIGPGLTAPLGWDRSLLDSATMPALLRYTGVLFDALDAASLGRDALDFAAECVVIHSALFGLLAADDPIPAYRLSHNSALPGLVLRKLWPTVVSRELTDGFILDLRSEAYVALGPVPASSDSRYLRVVARAPSGEVRALNHFNKRGKGMLVRAIVQSGIRHDSADSLVDWARTAGIDLSPGSPGELNLCVEQVPVRRGQSSRESSLVSGG